MHHRSETRICCCAYFALPNGLSCHSILSSSQDGMRNPLGTLYLIPPAEQIAFTSLSCSHFHCDTAEEKKVSDDLQQEIDNMPSWQH